MLRSILESYLLRKLPATVKSENVEEVTANENLVNKADPLKCLEQMTFRVEKDFCEGITIKSKENIKKEDTDNGELNQQNEYFGTTFEDWHADECTQMYKCKFCEYRIKTKQALLRHFRTKHGENAKLFQCDICNYKTKISTKLKQHKKHVHTHTVPWYHCQFCDFKTKQKQILPNHERTEHHLNICYSCHISKETFESLESLKTHLNCEHDEELSQYECHHCEYTNMQKSRLKHHIDSEHNGDVEWHKCHLCEYKSKNKRSLKLHMNIKHELHTEQLRCLFCGFETHHKLYLQMHIKSKHKKIDENHQCHLCDKTYTSKQYLQIHIHNKHVRLFKCAHCIYTTRLEYSIKRHIMVHHEWALYETNVEKELSLHNRKEPTEEAEHYRCSHCDYETKNKHLLRDHIVIKHNDSDDQKDVEIFKDELDLSYQKLPETVKSELVEVSVNENVVSELDCEKDFNK